MIEDIIHLPHIEKDVCSFKPHELKIFIKRLLLGNTKIEKHSYLSIFLICFIINSKSSLDCVILVKNIEIHEPQQHSLINQKVGRLFQLNQAQVGNDLEGVHNVPNGSQ